MSGVMQCAAAGLAVLLLGGWPAIAAPNERPVHSAEAGHDYDAVCGICHDANGYGTQRLRERLGEEKALLAGRTDLEGDFVQQVVRNGYLAMPPMSRVAVSDPELNDIIAFLTKHHEKRE